MTTRIAIDCMGGDHGPSVTVPAALRFLREDPAVELILVGQEALLRPLLLGEEANSRLRLQHASEVIGMDEAPAQALRSKKKMPRCASPSIWSRPVRRMPASRRVIPVP